MNGQWLGRRTIRTNWATRKPTDMQAGYYKPSVDEIYSQTGPDNSSVYVGNISQSSTGKFFAYFAIYLSPKNLAHF